MSSINIFYSKKTGRALINKKGEILIFVDNAVVKRFEEEEKYDKFATASTLSDVSFIGAASSLKEK